MFGIFPWICQTLGVPYPAFIFLTFLSGFQVLSDVFSESSIERHFCSHSMFGIFPDYAKRFVCHIRRFDFFSCRVFRFYLTCLAILRSRNFCGHSMFGIFLTMPNAWFAVSGVSGLFILSVHVFTDASSAFLAHVFFRSLDVWDFVCFFPAPRLFAILCGSRHWSLQCFSFFLSRSPISPPHFPFPSPSGLWPWHTTGQKLFGEPLKVLSSESFIHSFIIHSFTKRRLWQEGTRGDHSVCGRGHCLGSGAPDCTFSAENLAIQPCQRWSRMIFDSRFLVCKVHIPLLCFLHMWVVMSRSPKYCLSVRVCSSMVMGKIIVG